jgi:hypothetical protein
MGTDCEFRWPMKVTLQSTVWHRRRKVRRNRGRLRQYMVLALAAWVVATTGGCRGKGRLHVSPVRGQVVYKGQGVPGTTIIFFPIGDTVESVGKMRPFAYGQPDGRFEIKTYVEGDGAPPGKYRVSIIAPAGGPGGSMKDRPADAPAIASGVGVPPAIAKKYANVDTAGIEVTIEEGENNLEPFVLTMERAAAARSAMTSSQN